MGYFKQLATRRYGTWQRQRGQDRGKDFFGPEAELTLPTKPPPPASHVTGEYHQPKHTHRCKTFWRASVDARGKVENIVKVRYEAWRNVPLRNGGMLHCPKCYHERVLGFCQHIERVSLFYFEWESLRYVTIPTGEYKAFSSKIRMHNKRHEQAVNYTSFPLENDQTVILHDAPDWLGGETLPSDRPRLYALVSKWAQTPKGKRAGRGFSTWGETPAADDNDESDGDSAGQGRGDEAERPAAYIFGQHYLKVASIAAAHLGIDAHGKATKTPGLDASALIDLLEKADISYGIEGEIPGVTDKASNPDTTSVKRNATARRPEPTGHEGERRADNIKISEPKPIREDWLA